MKKPSKASLFFYFGEGVLGIGAINLIICICVPIAYSLPLALTTLFCGAASMFTGLWLAWREKH